MEISKIIFQMTLEEKAILLTGAASMNTAEIQHLGIKSVYMADGPHGIRAAVEKNCTSFPCLAMVGATWNKDLVYEMGVALADECIEHDINTILGPGINIKRTPVCGRNFEYVSEDPVLSGEIGAAYINGVQSRGVGTCLKHFALNNQEKYRMNISSEADIRVMREIYLRGFEIAIKRSNPYSVMCAYNKVNSIYCSENKYLLTDVLRDEWKYDGIVISDWCAVHDICKAVTAGLDLQMPKNSNIVKQITVGIENSSVTMEEIDKAIERLLKFIEKNKPVKAQKYDRKKQHEVARKVAGEGIVLLKNDNDVLPINAKKNKKIAVIGDFAEKPLITGQGSAQVYPAKEYISNPIEELKNHLGEEVEVKYLPAFKNDAFPEKAIWGDINKWTDFVAGCDAVIVFTGAMVSEDTEQFDRRTIEFNPNYSFVIENVARVNRNVVVVVQSGSAMIFDDWKNKVAGIVQMWLAGEAAGEAIVDVLTGIVNPSGKLSETFPKIMRKDLEYPGDGLKVSYDERLDVGYRYYDKHPEETCYPFGFGLSYTKFDFSEFNLTKTEKTVDISFKIQNVGKLGGSEVVQLYIGKEQSCVTRSPKELKAFEKVYLEKGEIKDITLSVEIEDLSYFNVSLNKWSVEPGVYKFMLGTSSQDIIYSEKVSIDIKDTYTMKTNAKAVMG